MGKRLLLCVVFLGLLCCEPILAQDVGVPDTIYYGDQGYAYAIPGGSFYVPVYLFSDQTISGLDFAIEYGAGTIFPTWDSTSKVGTDLMNTNYFDLGFPLSSPASIDGIATDTLLTGGVCLSQSAYLPPGRHHLCNVWFHGAGAGDVLPFDTATHVTSGKPGTLVQGELGLAYPQFVTGDLTLVESPALIYPVLPEDVVGDAASLITFSVSVVGAYPPLTVSLDSLISTETVLPSSHLPTTSGSNPLTVEWTPQYEEFGAWQAWFTGTDSQSAELGFSVPVAVNWVPTPCDVLRGDTDCDGIVNISDVVYLVNYIFGQGKPPGCEKK